MNATTKRLVTLLRVAYVAGAALFLVDLMIAFAASKVTVSDGGIDFDVAEGDPVNVTLQWLALVAFGCAAVGAVLTVAAGTAHEGRDGEG